MKGQERSPPSPPSMELKGWEDSWTSAIKAEKSLGEIRWSVGRS